MVSPWLIQQRDITIQMHILLWEGDDDIIFLKQFDDSKADVAANHSQISLCGGIDPDVRAY